MDVKDRVLGAIDGHPRVLFAVVVIVIIIVVIVMFGKQLGIEGLTGGKRKKSSASEDQTEVDELVAAIEKKQKGKGAEKEKE